ncbi:MAG: class I SAM-dependent methyltransferase [Bacteroidia bacterium]|nr:class I SAM-dependent methyltransferase [Bacteroidia bacterium]
MNWEETIKFIRTKKEYKVLVEKAYFEEDLQLNVERFRKSEEFLETLHILKNLNKKIVDILDIGSGNGISAIAFALEGYNVTCIEPDPSDTIGAGAIEKLKQIYNLDNLNVFQKFAEEINFQNESFDLVYARQCMHHALELNKFVSEASRVLKKTGVLFTVRDHVIYNKKDKEWFLKHHPLQKFYGGENAYTSLEYKSAISKAELTLIQEIKYYESVINYFPLSKKIKELNGVELSKYLESQLKINHDILYSIPFFKRLYVYYRSKITTYNEIKVPGRMYSYIAFKNNND